MTMPCKKKYIIVIEDSEADASVIQEALDMWSLDCEVKRFRDGADAIPTLLDERTPVPDVILLDLNMPRSDGLDILRKIRNTPRLTYTPVGILTGSRASSDKLRASIIGATRYINKPMSYEEYVLSVRQAVQDMLHEQ
jgi:CheY-like chemotaxis protein